MKKNIICILCLAALVSLAGCVGQKGVDVTRFGLDDASISADLDILPQDLTVYAERAGRDKRLMDPERQGREDSRFDELFFAAWDPKIPPLPKGDVFEAVRNMDPAKGFAENLRPYSPERWETLVSNAFMEGYGGFPSRPAITVKTTHLRRMPTDAPFFLDPGRSGEGFPFDYMQNSVLWVGTPAAVTHVSRDRMWAFVQTSLVSGWARVEDLASVDQAFMKAWRERPLAVIVRDGVEIITAGRIESVTGQAGAAEAFIGTILPLAKTPANTIPAKSPHVFVHVPLRGAGGKAIIATALAPMYATRQKPLPLTPVNVAMVGNDMMGQPYGWGGLFGQRDCSAAMRDLFAPFGLWLPRNSLAQGRMGERVDLAGLTPDEKEQTIMRDGIPFFSLVSMPGHVGLYLGSYAVPRPTPGSMKDEREIPVMFHNVWGLRVITGSGDNNREGRGIIGKAVVTSLRPGAEHKTISTPASILDRITGLAVLSEPCSEVRGAGGSND